jgi:Glycosyl transferase family 90
MNVELLDQIAIEQTSRWFNKMPSKNEMVALNNDLNDHSSQVFIFEFVGNVVRIKSKPSFYDQEQMSNSNLNLDLNRAWAYLNHFQKAMNDHKLSLNFEIAMSMGDGPIGPDRNFPTFAFQKRHLDKPILIPDVDIINDSNHKIQDSKSYSEKVDKAMFVGATTGSLHTVASLKKLENDRIRTCLFFQGNPRVDFKLAQIVQCGDDEASELLKSMNIISDRIDWKDQLDYKFLISVDGNGATCSRVLIALMSNSVLIKSYSTYKLFYFSKLKEFEHYIPFHHPGDISYYLNNIKYFNGEFSRIAENGKKFYEDVLSIDSLYKYTSLVLEKYDFLANQSS